MAGERTLQIKENFAVFKLLQIYAGKLPDKWRQNETMKNSNRNTDFNYVLL